MKIMMGNIYDYDKYELEDMIMYPLVSYHNGQFVHYTMEDLKLNGERRKRIKEDKEYARLAEIEQKKWDEWERRGLNPIYECLMEMAMADDGLI